MGNTHLTLMNFSWATDLDPRGANNQIKGAIDKQYTNEDDEVHGSNDQSKYNYFMSNILSYVYSGFI